MILHAVRTNQLSQAGFEWYVAYLTMLDSGNHDGYAAFLDPDCILQANNDLPLYGIDAIKTALAAYWRAFAKIEHEVLNIYGTDDQFAVELLCHYTRKDGKRITIPAAAFMDRGEDGQAVMINLYANASPVFV